jgi:two-component system copper resistance phosphate regulon response regulator CusR
MRLLIVEDSARLRRTLARAMSLSGHAVDEAADGREADAFVRHNRYDAIVLDLMLPGRGGFEILSAWRRSGVTTPVVILTARHEVDDRVRGLALGADDYLPKPFAMEELAARLEAVVRRDRGQADSQLRIGGVEIDLAARAVRRGDEVVALTAREFALLECLARRPGQVLSREQIEGHLYNESDSPVSNAVDAAVYSLRKKLCPPGTPQLIRTRRGLGYVLEAP